MGRMRYVTTVDDRTFVVEIAQDGEIIIDGQAHVADMRHIESISLYSLLIDNRSHEAFITEHDGKYRVMLRGRLYTVQVQGERFTSKVTPPQALSPIAGEVCIEAPLPGVVVEVLVAPAQPVRAGEALLILESMKMANRVTSPRDGVVQTVSVAVGDSVQKGQALVTVL
jgi:biotin carboxyl carrier protein